MSENPPIGSMKSGMYSKLKGKPFSRQNFTNKLTFHANIFDFAMGTPLGAPALLGSSADPE